MIIMNSNVVVRYCLDRAFLINIHTNKILTLKKEAVNFLLNRIENGLSIGKEDCSGLGFKNMVDYLLEENFLEEVVNDI